MYESFYNLHPTPFRLTPDPHFYFNSGTHKRGLAYFYYAIQQREGAVVITGQPGTGKTELMLNLLDELPQHRFTCAKIVSTNLEADEFLALVAASFNLRTANSSKGVLLKHLEEFLYLSARAGKQVLLVVDEAHNLSEESLIEASMMMNFQYNNTNIMQVFLVGQELLADKLNQPRLAHLKQRVIAASHLEPLSLEETQAYVQHRLQQAHWQGDPELTDATYELVHRFSGGIPRKINLICNRVFLQAYLDELHVIDAPLVHTTINELHEEAIIEQYAPNSPSDNRIVVPLSRAGQFAAQPNQIPPKIVAANTIQFRARDNNVTPVNKLTEPRQNNGDQHRNDQLVVVGQSTLAAGRAYKTAVPLSAPLTPATPSTEPHDNQSEANRHIEQKIEKFVDNTATEYQHTVKHLGGGLMDKELRSFAAIYEKNQQSKQTSNQPGAQHRDTQHLPSVSGLATGIDGVPHKPLFNKRRYQQRLWKRVILGVTALVLIVLYASPSDIDRFLRDAALTRPGSAISPTAPAADNPVPDIRVPPGRHGLSTQSAENQSIPDFLNGNFMNQYVYHGNAPIFSPAPMLVENSPSAASPGTAAEPEKPATRPSVDRQQQAMQITETNAAVESVIIQSQNTKRNTTTPQKNTDNRVANQKHQALQEMKPVATILPPLSPTQAPIRSRQEDSKGKKPTILVTKVTPPQPKQPLSHPASKSQHTPSVVKPPKAIISETSNTTTLAQRASSASPLQEAPLSSDVNDTPNKNHIEQNDGESLITMKDSLNDKVSNSREIQTAAKLEQPRSAALTPSTKAFSADTNTQSHAPKTPLISKGELNAVLATLTRAYESGNLAQLSTVLSSDIRSNTAANRFEIENEYKRLFNVTDLRRMQIYKAIWSEKNNMMHGVAVFNLQVREKGATRINAYQGVLRVDVAKSEHGAVIKNINYLYNNDK